jgi:hypothetical protein
MLETILGSLVGGMFRVVPEAMKMFDRKNERAHEAVMVDKQFNLEKLKTDQTINLEATKNSGALGLAEVQAIVEATKAQATSTGIAWVDAISSLMRPVITFWWVIVMYSVALAAQYFVLIDAGETYTSAILGLWGPNEKSIVSSIISFWFVDRSLRKK